MPVKAWIIGAGAVGLLAALPLSLIVWATLADARWALEHPDAVVSDSTS